MKQQEVKIIGLTINEKMGILQSCKLQFDQNNRLIAIKGESGSGKTTLQKGLKLGTLGSDTLKDDKQLYGDIDEEVQLLDGNLNIFIGCKSNSKGSLDYVIYTKDSDGKILKDPIIDGVKLTPANYLKSLQTDLTWRMEELTSENPTVQRKILLDLYKRELAKLGVVFDKNSQDYSNSILGRIELAENERSNREFLRKQVGGFQNQLEPLGISPEEPSTYPKFIDISKLEDEKSSLKFKIDNVEQSKQSELDKIKNSADAVIIKIKEENSKIKESNSLKGNEFEKKKSEYSQHLMTKSGIQTDLLTLKSTNCISDDDFNKLSSLLDSSFKPTTPMCEQLEQEVEFDEEGKVVIIGWNGRNSITKLIAELIDLKAKYSKLLNQPSGDTTELEKQLETVVNNIILAKENNKKVDMLNSYLNWHEANEKVIELRNEYAQLLSSVDTGVEGLKIEVDKSDSGKLDIYLTYDGSFDPAYFYNPMGEPRKLSTYSGTQKPLICLLLQNHLLSQKPKAMRYLWIDDVPIDSKSKALLNKMGEELNLTVIVNITGDFTRDTLQNGEILIEGGEVFFGS